MTFVVIGIQEQVLHILSTIVVLNLSRSLWLIVNNLMSMVVAELIESDFCTDWIIISHISLSLTNCNVLIFFLEASGLVY